MIEERRPIPGTRADTNRVAVRRSWIAPQLTTVDVADVTAAGASGVTDAGIFT